MTEEQDRRIADLLRGDAPPARDPVFRLQVLERRERQQFHRQLFTILAGASVIFLISAFAISIGRGALEATAALVVAATLVSAWLAFRNGLPQIFRRFSL